MLNESQITRVLKQLRSTISSDITGLTEVFNKFLQIQQDYLITFMNNQFFRGEDNLLIFLTRSLEEGLSSEEEIRKMVYVFVADYIETYKSYLGDYLKGLFTNFYIFFKRETGSRSKEKSLGPIREILLNFSENDLNGVIDPSPGDFHTRLTDMLKIDKLTSSVRGQLWNILGILQNKFALSISYTKKKQVQIISLSELKSLVNSDKNLSTIASILRSFIYSLNQSHLDDRQLQQLFNYTKAIMIPLKATFDASTAALQLISAQSSLFHPFIMKNALSVFKTLSGLMGHQNKQYKFAVLDTLAIVVKQIVIGISTNIDGQQNKELFNFIGNTMWQRLEEQTKFDQSKPEEKNRYAGSVISIVKILGTLSPLILSINGMHDLKRFFGKLLSICNRKVIRAFEEMDGSSGATKKIHVMKIILYNQKQLVSFISSFAKILEQLDQVQYKEALNLQQLFLVGVRQYPFYLQKYIPQLIEAMVQFLMGLSTKPHIFNPWCKKMILISLMESLDAKRFNINTDKDYYLMIRKSSKMWTLILTHPLWSGIVIKQFSKILFDSLEHLFLNLDISYKTNIELQIESEQKEPRMKEQEIQLANVFFLADENIQMSNLSDYQYVSSLALVYNEIMLAIDQSLYYERVYGFYQPIVYRLKIFPKSIPLMKVVRSLNAYISRTNWFSDSQMEGENKKSKEIVSVLTNFYKFVCDNIFKYQENYFYEALKMLMSMPLKVFLADDCDILKNHLPGIITKSLQLGQQIISLAHQTINCLSVLFKNAKQQSVSYLSPCIPYLQKYINFNKNAELTQSASQQKQEVRSYLFLYECSIRRQQISTNVMKFLGSIGGYSHMMVENTTKDYISWDYYCKLDLTVYLKGDTLNINLTKLLARTCWLMLHGSEVQKIVSSQFIHAIMIYVIGRAASKANTMIQETKENLSNFFDRILPTLLHVGSNPSHPSQQLVHTLIIQTIHFLANTQDSNSPDIQTLLKHLISLYTGAEDMSFLASKCLSELVKWHIKQAPSLEQYSYPLIKTVLRNVWSLVSNKKARNGLIQFLIKFLKAIHRQYKLMTMYAIQLCSLIISLGRTDKQMQPLLEYLVKKYVLAIGPYIKPLIIEEGSRRFKKLSTLQKLLLWIYNNALFSVYRQQRTIAYMLWEAILSKYGHFFNSLMNQNEPVHNIQIFLSEQCNKELKYLFGHSRPLSINEDEPKLDKVLPKISAYGQMWIKIVQNDIFQPTKLTNFKDLQDVYLQSFCSFIDYLTHYFINLQPNARIISYQAQKSVVDCILTFIELYLGLGKNCTFMIDFMIKKVPIFERRKNVKNITFVELLFKLLFKPNGVIPNFNFDIIYECYQHELGHSQSQKSSQFARKEKQQNYYFKKICAFLQSILSNNLYPALFNYLKSEFKKQNIEQLIPYIIHESTFYDRQIKCILNTMAILAKLAGKDNKIFISVLKTTLQLAVHQYEQKNKLAMGELRQNQKEISAEKKSLLIWYILQHAQEYSVIKDFLVRVIKQDTIIYQKHEKAIMKSIINNWNGVKEKIVDLAHANHEFLSLIFVLCKMLSGSKLQDLYELIQQNLIGVGVKEEEKKKMMIERENENSNKSNKGNTISQMLKICFYIIQDNNSSSLVTRQYKEYIHELVCAGLNTKFSIDIHEQALNLAGILIKQHSIIDDDRKYEQFVDKFRQCLFTLTNFYIPLKISKLPTSEARNKCASYLRVFRSMVILSNNIRYLQFIFSLLKDQELQGYYYDLLQQVINQCLASSYENSPSEKQADDLKWMIGLYWQPGMDTDCWRNFRVVVVDEVLVKAIKITRQDVLIQFFQREVVQLIKIFTNEPIGKSLGSVKQLVMSIQLKRAAFKILEQLYSNLPRKQKNTQQIYKLQHHKTIIKYCLEYCKQKFNEQAQLMLRQYDKKTAEEQKQKLVITKSQKLQGKRPTCIQYLRRLCCGAYNCLIVIFISTQSNKAHFQSYLFDSKGLLWKNIVDENKAEFQFDIQTNFAEMKPISKINKKLNKKIKDKYWSNSLYAIQEQYVPSSLVQSLPMISNVADEQKPQNQQNSLNAQQSQNVVELDPINKHPCMINLLRVIDFMHQKFFDGTLPGWMKPIHEELSSDTCPLSVRVLLTKLIINRRLIFTQNIWADVLTKYLVLKDNGGKFVHYFFRDAVKQLLQFVQNGYKPENIADINNILMRVIRALPHEQKMIYSDNIDIMEALLKIPGVCVNKSTIVNMLKSNEKKKQGHQQTKLKFQWRMCAIIVMKSCLALDVPILDQNQILPKNADKSTKFRFYFDMRKQGYLNMIFQMVNETVKKYRIAAAGFLGELLHFLTQSQVQKLEQQQLVKLVAKFLSNINTQQSNRNSKEKFSLCILHVAKRFPQILDNQKLYNQIQFSLSTYRKQQRVQILQAILLYCQHLNKVGVIGYIPHIFITIRSIVNTLLNDIHQVQVYLITILNECCKQEILINKQVIETYFYVYNDLERVYANSVHANDAVVFYKILIALKDFTGDADLPKTTQIRQLNEMVNKGLLKGLGSHHQQVKELIFSEFENQSKQYQDSASRMLDIIVKLYDPEHEDLWLVNVVPLILSTIKQSSDYTRLRFEEALGDLTAFYDWDFRKNMKLHNNSQPYTPAFTLATGANNLYRRQGGTAEQSFNPTIGGQKLKGMIKASQNFYMSQQEQVFTILASQSDYQPSFQASLNSERDSPMSSIGQASYGEGQANQNLGNNKINHIFKSGPRKRNRIMQDFNQTNMRRYPSSIKVVDNKVRFNKNYDKSVSKPGQFSPSFGGSQQEVQGQSKIGNRGVLIRKYKVGELPDIQITTKDLVDPMLFLAGKDHQFAGELFILVFMKLCLYARKQKKDKFKQTICWLLRSSRKYEYNFISTLEKSLICLCHNQKQKLDFSMKEIGMKSNTLDYAIVFTQQNQIQTIKQPDFQNQQSWKRKVNDIWGDLVDLYQQINEEDWIYGVLIRLAEGDERKLLLQALNLKKLGNIKKSQQALNVALDESNNRRIKQFINREKIDCNTILGAWQPVVLELNRKMQTSPLEINEQKILTVALQNTRIQQKSQFFKKMVFHDTKCEYEKAILYILCEKDYDMAYHHLQKSITYFSSQWKKISSFAFNSKHLLLEEVQKKYQLQQFLQLYRKDQIKESQYDQLFTKWSDRQPNSIYDSNLTFLQILQSRIMFSQLLSNKFSIDQKVLVRSTIDWLIQTSNGMIEKGVLGGAETLIKKALTCKKKQKQFFIWDFYDSVAKLKLKQLLVQKSKNFKDYEIVSELIQKQMNSSKIPISQLQKLKLKSLKNDFFEGYLSSCLSSEQPIITANFINKVQMIFSNYGDIRKSIKQNIFGGSTTKQFEQYKRDMYFKFTLFLQKMLSFVNEKTNFLEIKQSMVQKNYSAQRLAHLFVETLFISIQISDFTNNIGNFEQNMLFSLIMKLLKIIQTYPVQVGQYFSEAVNNKRIPIWIFLYFVPQMIKFINNPNLVGYFEDLFRSIASIYPEALIYHFNCSYEQEKDQTTPFCIQLSKYLREKMDVNYKFIDSLVLLQYPEIRLRQSLSKFVNIACERENAILQLKQLIRDTQFLGKYNKKFVQDWAPKVIKVLNKIQSNDLSVFNDIKVILSYIDPSKKQNLKTVAARMKDFVKVSDGSLFFQQYNSNDWNRIQIPGTSYRKFQEPKPWKKLFIQSFDHSLLTLQSKQRPRRITIYGSNEKKYMLLIKAGQDVRLDQRIQQLFEIMNRILKGHSDSSKKQLQIKRFEVTPIRKMMGIFQWVDESQTLKQFLETEFKIIKQTDKVNFKDGNKAFEFRMQFLNRIAPMTAQIKDPNHQHKALLNASKPDVVKCFMQCEKQIPYGLLRRALQRLSKNYDSFLHIKNAFIANYALVCCVTYILGIGDRHLENFLIHMGSASVVPIDFGYSFGASLELGVPQLMPFRLTKSFEQLMEPVGFQGVFKKSMISSFEAFSQNVALISDYCQVFVDDPLLQWVWTNKKNVSQASVNKNSQFSSSQDRPQKALFTQKIGSVRKKLEGINPRFLYENMLSNSRHKHSAYAKTLSDAIWGKNTNRVKKLNISDLVDELISLATDKNILGRTYIGWNPYV